MRKNCEKWPNIVSRAPQKDMNQKCCRSPLGPVWPLLRIYQALKSPRKISYHAGGSRGPPRIETLRGAARGSYLETVPQHFSNPSTHFQIFPPIRLKFILKLAQILPRPSQILPKSSQILRKIDPKLIQKPSWSPFWINALQKLDFERPRNGQEAPKRDQKTPQSVPTLSQMDRKTVPNPFLEHFF